MYSKEICVSTVSIIVGDDALGVPFGGVTPWFWYLRCWIIRGDIVVIISVNSMGEEYRDAEGVVPYRCGGIVCMIIEPYYHRGSVSSTGERCSPLQFCCRKIVGLAVFIFNFQVAFGVWHWVLCPWLRIHKIPQCTPTLWHKFSTACSRISHRIH